MSSTNKILTSGYNELYNEIYCNLFNNNNGYKQCKNCNFGNLEVWKNVDSTGEGDCMDQCTKDDRCTSYSYNSTAQNHNCTKYIGFPTQIIENIPNTNSGYSLTKFGFDFNNLTPDQQQNIQYKCGNQFINNTFTQEHPNLNLTPCFSINNSNNISQLNLDPQCVFTTYSQNNLPVNIQNTQLYTDTLANGQAITNKSDPNIDNNYNIYNQYYNSKDNSLELNKQLIGNNGNIFSESDQNVSMNNNSLYNNFKDSLNKNFLMNNTNSMISSALGIQEGFDNQNKKNNFMFIILLIFLILFLFYVFKKK